MTGPIGIDFNPNDGLGGSGDAYGTDIKGLRRPDIDYEKVSKESVHYRQSASGEMCGTCQNSRFGPGSETGVCMVVAGEISASAVCDSFAGFAVVSAYFDQLRSLPRASLVTISKALHKSEEEV